VYSAYKLNNQSDNIQSWHTPFPIWKQSTVPYSVLSSVSPVAQSCPILCDPVDCSTPGLPVHHQLLELAQTHVHLVSDAIQPSHPLSSRSPAFNLSQHQGLSQWVSSSNQVAKVLLHCSTSSSTTGKFLKRWEYQTTLPVSWETCMQVKRQQLEHWDGNFIPSFYGVSMLFSTVTVSIYIPTRSAKGFPFFHILSSIYYL